MKPHIKLKSRGTQRKASPSAIALARAFDITPEQAELQAPTLIAEIRALKGRATIPAALAKERSRIQSIIRACQVTGQSQLIERLVSNGMGEGAAADYVFDVASSSNNAHAINGSHSPEGGHRGSIDHNTIYARHNRR